MFNHASAHTNSGEQHPVLTRNNVKVIGSGPQVLMLAHGFGCDQTMWQYLIPYLESSAETRFTFVLFDYVGSGQSDVNGYQKSRYETLDGYAQDVLDICDALSLSDITFVGHSVSSVIGMIASLQQPEYFKQLVMVCPSPCFLNLPPDYYGGFDKADLEELINLMDKNYLGWASYLAPLVMGDGHDTNFKIELEESFCSTDPKFAKPFAKATFFSDYRQLLPRIDKPVLILQSQQDALAAVSIGEYMQSEIPNATLHVIDSHGHCLHMTNPREVAAKITAVFI
ncbi:MULTISPECIES: alpha/beta fold hydrolase [Alteromonas]|jgi:sigma-B regulation protein RsbQ|nr:MULTISPECIES: alpha/beta hydrolase [Alteromonas]|tara:strand:+ start:3232 stop:4080 length:849 start_codon:yes stop_codon:yes gene_type:complete